MLYKRWGRKELLPILRAPDNASFSCYGHELTRTAVVVRTVLLGTARGVTVQRIYEAEFKYGVHMTFRVKKSHLFGLHGK